MKLLEADPAVLDRVESSALGYGRRWIGSTAVHVREFLHAYGRHIHALEINGLRSWQENLSVVSLGREFDYPVVAGGDRHGLEPNAIINLTRAKTFAEFAEEIRVERSSDIAILPQYQEPLALRHLLCAWDAVREHPQLADRQYLGCARVLSCVRDGWSALFPRVWTREHRAGSTHASNVIGLIASPPVRTAARLASLAAGSAAH